MSNPERGVFLYRQDSVYPGMVWEGGGMKQKFLYTMGLCFLLFSGCAAWGKENGKTGILESSDNTSHTSDIGMETKAEKYEDAWGLDAIMELFDIWGSQPSSNPASLENIADRAGYSQEYIEENIRNAEEVLMRFPEMKAGNPEVSFYTEESEKQFLSIEWDDYVFLEAKANIFNSDSQGLWGHSFLCNSLQNRMEDKPAVFISYYYRFETQQLEIVEIVEAPQEINDYACILDYEEDGQRVFMRAEEGVRLLNPAAELNPCENVLPVPGLEGKELEQYIALAFLDIVRDTHNLGKYEKVFSEDSFRLLQQLDCYYDRPEEVYDFAKFGGNGDIIITSQFQPTLWGSILIDIDIQFVYDMETGRILVKEGQFILTVKP